MTKILKNKKKNVDCSPGSFQHDSREIYFWANKVSPIAGADPPSHPLVEFSPQEAGGNAADGVAVAADLWLTDGQSGGFGRQSGLQVEVDSALVVSLALLHLPSLLVLTRFCQPAVVVPPQVVQLWVALRSFNSRARG